MQKPSLQNIAKIMACLIFSVALCVSVLACFSVGNAKFELLCHFKMHYFILSLMLLVISLFKRKPAWIVVALSWFIFNTLPVIPYYLPVKPAETALHRKIKLMQLNVLLTNQSHDKVLALIQKEKPDIIGLEEFTFQWAAKLKPIEQEYPYHVIEPQNWAFGVALYSKFPLTDTHIKNFGPVLKNLPAKIPSIVTSFQLEKQPVTLIVTHPVPPTLFDLRNSELDGMGQARSRFNKNLIIMGDLNSTQWSPYFQKLLQQTGLRDSQLGFGVQPSWQSTDWLLRIPIDHILISPNIAVLNRYIGPSIDSDHLPVFAEIALK